LHVSLNFGSDGPLRSTTREQNSAPEFICKPVTDSGKPLGNPSLCGPKGSTGVYCHPGSLSKGIFRPCSFRFAAMEAKATVTPCNPQLVKHLEVIICMMKTQVRFRYGYSVSQQKTPAISGPACPPGDPCKKSHESRFYCILKQNGKVELFVSD
jgi:hypothetical protein